MRKSVIIVSAVFLLSGCSTVSKVVSKVVPVSCKKQVELATEAISTTGQSVFVAYEGELITQEKKNQIIDELLSMNGELFQLNNECSINPDGAKAKALELTNDALAKGV